MADQLALCDEDAPATARDVARLQEMTGAGMTAVAKMIARIPLLRLK